MELDKIISEKVNTILDSKMDEILEKKITQMLDNIFSDIFGSWSDVTRKLKEDLASSINIDLSRVKVETYNEKVIQAIHNVMDKFLDDKATKILQERINSEFTFIQKKDWKMSELVEVFAEDHRPDSPGDTFEPTIIVEESSYGFQYIYFDEDGGKRPNDCKYQMMIDKEGLVRRADIVDWRNRKNTQVGLTGYKFEQVFFALYANGCTLEVDTYETEFYYDQN